MAKNFEEKLERIEEIKDELQSEDIPIEKAMQLFEEGTKIADALTKELDKMERKIEILTNKPSSPDEKPNFDLFPELDE